MKKDTVCDWIVRQRDLIARKEKNAVLRAAKKAALQQCESWLFALTWAHMRAPVRKKREDIAAEGLPLIERKKNDPASLSEQEATRLLELAALGEVYEQFENKITPTALRAEFERESRQREQAQRAATRQRAKGRG